MFGANFAGSVTCRGVWQSVWPSQIWDKTISRHWATMEPTPNTSWENNGKHVDKLKGKDTGTFSIFCQSGYKSEDYSEYNNSSDEE